MEEPHDDDVSIIDTCVSLEHFGRLILQGVAPPFILLCISLV